jgi:malic enzyme
VNNVYIFPGLSFGAAMCQASSLPDSTFLAAAEAVARSLSAQDIAEDRVVPHPDRIREVSLNVATATVLECQRLGLASRPLGETEEAVKSALQGMMWAPPASLRAKSRL